MAYIDGFLIPVPKKNAAKYKKMSKQAGKVWMLHALRKGSAWPTTSCTANSLPFRRA